LSQALQPACGSQAAYLADTLTLSCVICHSCAFLREQCLCAELAHSFPDETLQVTICAALFRKFPWKKVPLYILGQLLGAFFGSLFVYANYFHAIDLFEGGNGVRTVPGTASLFASYAVSSRPEELIELILMNAFACPIQAPYMSSANCFFDEVSATKRVPYIV
jgi:hypothetical protein